MKNRTFWILVIGTGLVGWNVAMAQIERDLDDYALLTSEAAAADGLHVMDADGRNLRPFVAHPEYTAHGSPAWSCDGSKLAFDAWRSGRGETYVVAHIFTCTPMAANRETLGSGRHAKLVAGRKPHRVLELQPAWRVDHERGRHGPTTAECGRLGRRVVPQGRNDRLYGVRRWGEHRRS